MASRDIPNLILGKVYGPKLGAYLFHKPEETLSSLERMLGSYSLISLFQIYAAPMTAVTSKMINDPMLSFKQASTETVFHESNQLFQRILSRSLLVAGRNTIAIVGGDLLYLNMTGIGSLKPQGSDL